MLHSPEPSSASNSNTSCRVHPRGMELPSPIQANTLQAKCLRCCTHQPIVLRFSGAERKRSLSLAVSANCTASQHQRTAKSTLSCSDATSVVCVAPGLDSCDTLLPLEQSDQSGTLRGIEPISSNSCRPGSMAVATCAPSLYTRHVSQVCHCIVFAR